MQDLSADDELGVLGGAPSTTSTYTLTPFGGPVIGSIIIGATITLATYSLYQSLVHYL